MHSYPHTRFWKRSLVKLVHVFTAVIAGSLLAQTTPPPEQLYDAGDYYVLRDRSAVPLLRSGREIALKRAKVLDQAELLRIADAARVVSSLDAFGASTTHQIEIYAVSDPRTARDRLKGLEGVAWVSPVLATAEATKRVLLSDEIIVQVDDAAPLEGTVDVLLEELSTRGIEVVRTPLPSGPGSTCYGLVTPIPKSPWPRRWLWLTDPAWPGRSRTFSRNWRCMPTPCPTIRCFRGSKACATQARMAA
jgi:hypothetical protein